MDHGSESREHVGELIGQGAFTEALSLLDKLIGSETNQKDLRDWLLYRGLASYFLGLFAVATRAYEEVLLLDESCSAAHSCLANIFASCPESEFRNPENAIYHATRSCELTSWQMWQPLAALAAAYARSGEYVQAEDSARKAVEIAPHGQAKQRVNRLLALILRREAYTANVEDDFKKMMNEVNERARHDGR